MTTTEVLTPIFGLPGYDPTPTDPRWVFDYQAARLAVDFFPRYLRHVKGPMAGKPFELLPWQKALVANLWGWRDGSKRRYLETFIFVPKKNGKSCLAAGLCLFMLMEGEQGGEIYSAASSMKQAGNVYDHAHGMVIQSKELQKSLKVYGGFGGNHAKSILNREKFSRYSCIAADSATADGSNVSGAIVDELHRFWNRAHYEFCQVLEMGTAARDDALIVYTTTSDYARESVCNTKLSYARKVRDGIIQDDRYLPCIFEATSDDDWEDEAVWERVNPSIGDTVTLDFLRREHRKAKEMPSHRNTFMRLHLNLQTLVDDAWALGERWDDLARDWDDKLLEGEECFAGLDLSSHEDMTALVLLFPLKGKLYVKSWFWAPRDKAEEREAKSGAPYVTWEAKGNLELTPGAIVDYDRVQQKIEELGKTYKIREIATDPHWAQQLMTKLDEQGFQMVKFGQYENNYHGPVRELEALAITQGLYHDGNPILRWNVLNTSLSENSKGLVMPSKRRSPDKIDGVTALLMALGRYQITGTKRQQFAYSERGLFDVDMD